MTNKTILYTISYPHPYNKIGDGPEGPEVRIVCNNLFQRILNATIKNVIIGNRAKMTGLFNLSFPIKIIFVRSHGKKIIFDIENDQMIVVSLGMVGRLQYEKGKHTHIEFMLEKNESNFSLFFDDYRYMGKIDLVSYKDLNMYFSKIGPDLLDHALNKWISTVEWNKIFEKTKKSVRKIADVIMDQSYISGIGNYLRSEILYYSCICPLRQCKTLTEKEWEILRIVSHKIILLSYYHNGLTIKDFISPDGTYGTYPAAVYNKNVDGFGYKILKEKIGNGTSARSIFWVKEIQI